MSVRNPGQQHGRLGVLDCLRLVAALGVVAFHFTALHSPAWAGTVPPEAPNGITQFSAYGTLGVPLFFLISGFVALMTAWGRSIPAFVASRVGRLYPAYWVAAAGSVVLVLFLWRDNFTFNGITAPHALLNLSMLQGAFGVQNIDSAYWILWCEARFYLLIVLLLWVGMTRQRVLAFAGLWPVVGAMVAQAHSDFLTTLLLPDFAPFFAGGMLLYLIYREGHELVAWLLVGLQAVLAIYQAAPDYLKSISTEIGTNSSTARVAVC
ncbi:MAG: acyltransferase family protein, partial [Catenulispora sp.]